MASKQEIIEFLSHPRKIAIVGASTKEHKAGYFVPQYLQKRGFTIVPVNPNISLFLGENAIESIEDAPDDLDGVIIFRISQSAEKVAIKAVDMKIPLIWLPDRITSEKARQYAEERGIIFVQDRCALRDTKYLVLRQNF